MARRTLFTPKNTKEGWRLNIPEKYSMTGKRERHFFKTQKLALAAAVELKDKRDKFGQNALAISPTLADQATAAAKILAPLGIGLLEAVSRFAEIEIRNRASVPIEEAIAAFRATGDGWSNSQSTAYRLRGEKLIEAFPSRMLSMIGGEELRVHLEATTTGAGGYNQNLRLVRAIWNWCAKPPRVWCNTEATAHLETQATVSGEIGVLSSQEAEALLRTAEKHFPEAVPAFAIALFTGMRQAEIERLNPSDFTNEGITVPALSAKTKRRRFIQMPAPLAAWLAAYPIADSVCPTNWQRKEKAVRYLAGWRVWPGVVPSIKTPAKLEELTKKQREAFDARPAWPENALRHTAATIAIALGKPIETLTFEHGHVGGLEMLRRHYVGALPKSEAVKIWSIGPNGTKLPTMKIA
jgi:integrase